MLQEITQGETNKNNQMNKAAFLLQQARTHLTSKKTPLPKTSNRRQFIKTLGLGTLAVTPAMSAVKSIASEPFDWEIENHAWKVWRNGVLVWEVNTELFDKKTAIVTQKKGTDLGFKITNLGFKETLLNFTLVGTVERTLGQWIINIESPELAWKSSMNFIDFIDCIKPLSGEAIVNQKLLVHPYQKGDLNINGHANISLSPDWQIDFNGDKAVQWTVNDQTFTTDEVSIRTGFVGTLPFYEGVLTGSLLQLPNFADFAKYTQSFRYQNKPLWTDVSGFPSVNMVSGANTQLLWIDSLQSKIALKTALKETISLEKFFLFQDYGLATSIPTYWSGSLLKEGQWISHTMGSFKLVQNNDTPDFEMFSNGFKVEAYHLAPALQAFHPKLKNGFSSTMEYENPFKIQITEANAKASHDLIKNKYFEVPPQDTTRKAKTPIKSRKVLIQNDKKVKVEKVEVKEVKIEAKPEVKIEKVPEIQVGKGRKLDFIPKRPMSLKLLRPDDLIWLEVTLQNFKFISKNGKTHVALDNPSKSGTVTYAFPTQHTLEEAYYESSPMDTSSNEPITLPARHIRAHRSRLVYELEAGKPSFELSIEELLNWDKFTLKVHPRAYIKLPTITPIPVVKPINVYNATLIDNQHLERQTATSNLYSTKIIEKSKFKVDQASVYNKNVVKAVLPTGIASTLEPNFNVNVFKIDLKVAPIPETHTSIEAPALLYISPNQVNDFKHKISLDYDEVEERTILKANDKTRTLRPVKTVKNGTLSQQGKITELWHTSLGIKLKNNQVALNGLDKLKTIRALWAFDANESYTGCAEIDAPFQASLDASDRHKLVHTTSNYGISGFSPFPVPVKKLMLTSLGAYLDWHAYFDVPNPIDTHLNVIEWEHLATLGRDHYVKIVREGYLFPLGHRAALVKVTERKFDNSTKAAVNKLRMYIVILEKEKIYSPRDKNGAFIKFPFQTVRIENESTPTINKPENINLSSGTIGMIPMQILNQGCPKKPGRSSTYNFYIKVNNKPFTFDVTATDKEGVAHRAQMPLAFIENVTGRTKSMVEKMALDYNAKVDLNEIAFFGQQIAYAESLVDGDTALETQSFKFGGNYYPSSDAGALKFTPIMQNAEVYIKQVDEITGNRKAAKIELEDDKNDGMVFAKVSGVDVDFTGGSDKSGGFLSPNMSITGLSKLQGPIGGNIQDMMNLNFIPEKFFEAMGDLPLGKIFGAIDIISLLLNKPDIADSARFLESKLVQFKNDINILKTQILLLKQKAIETGEDFLNEIAQENAKLVSKVQELMDTLNSQIPKVPNLKTWITTEAMYAEYKWIPEFGGKEINLFGDLLKFKVEKPKEALTITTTLTKYLDGLSVPKLETVAKMNRFSIEIKDALVVNFNYMKFESGSTKKPDVKVDMDMLKPIEFVGALSFVNNLQSLIPNTGFSEDGPYVNLTMAGVRAGFNMSVPDVEVGVFSLTNMTLGAYIDLPFTGGELTMGFNFCTRENPFLLTVSGFGGGGYFLMITTLKGLKSVEAAFEFGASASLNVGVASGSVTIMGGFYFKYELAASGDEELNLSGYVRINGRMSVLGIISVSVEFYLSLDAVYVTKQLGNGQTVKKVEKMEGVARLKVKIEILFFSKTVTVTVRREFTGADADPTFGQMVLPEDWNAYCAAFAS